MNHIASSLSLAAAMLGCAWTLAHRQDASAAEAPDGRAQLSQPQISACSEEIRRERARWKYSPGEASAAVARFARIQKEMFEGRCAGHPQARAYVTGATRMLEHAKPAEHAGNPPR